MSSSCGRSVFLLLIEFSTFFSRFCVHEKVFCFFAKSIGIGAKTKKAYTVQSSTYLSLGLFLESKIFCMNDRPTKRSKWKINENKPEKFILFISGAIKAYALVQWSTVMNYYFSNFSGFFLIGKWKRRKKQWHVMENELNLWWDFSFHSDTQTRRIDHDWKENISSISS